MWSALSNAALQQMLHDKDQEIATLKNHIDVLEDRERATFRAWEDECVRMNTVASALASFVNFAHNTAPHNRSGDQWNIWLDFLEGLARGLPTAVSSPLRGSEREGPGESAQGASPAPPPTPAIGSLP